MALSVAIAGSIRGAPPAAAPFLPETERGTFEPAPIVNPREILFAGKAFDTRFGEPTIPADLRIDAYPPGRAGGWLVQFAGPIREAWRRDLLATGVEILGYVPNYTYLVRATADQMDHVSRLSSVVWTGIFQPAYKLSPDLDLGGGPSRVMISLFSGESVSEIQAAILAGGGRVLRTSSPSSRNPAIEAELDPALLRQLIGRPEGLRAEPLCFLDTNADQCQWVLQTFIPDNRKLWDNGLTGAGQVLATFDTGIRTDHNAFFDPLVPITGFGDYPTHRKIIAYRKSVEIPEVTFDDLPMHGTAVVGAACGNDAPLGNDPRDGMAKDAKIYFVDVGNDSTLYLPLDASELLVSPYQGNEGGAARIMWNSISLDGCTYMYTTGDMELDRFAWEHPDFLLVCSMSNQPPTRGVPPGSSKNALTVGGTLDGLDATQVWPGSCWGPGPDQRLKPNVCAPAVLSTCDANGTDTYATREGTSLSAAAMAGTLLLARQYLAEGRYPTGSPDPAHALNPSGALLRAMALNCGQDDITGYTVPNPRTGWGRPRLDDVLYFPGDARQTLLVDANGGLLTGEYVEYQFAVSDSTAPLRVTLVWADFPGLPFGDINLVNDLNLRVTGGGETYVGNNFLGGQSIPGGAVDYRNVEECVWRNRPVPGLWTVRVEAANVPVGPQPYALVVSGGLVTGMGLVTLDRAQYAGGDTLLIRVQDLNGGSTVTVQVESSTERTPETLRLESSGGGVYEGRFPTTLAAASGGDGALSVSHGDSLKVTYRDRSPFRVSTTSARVFLNPPVISAVRVLSAGSGTATVGWETSVPATSTVHYGTTPALGCATPPDPGLRSAHLVTLTGLSEDTTYFLDVESTDQVGNTVYDDNGGAHYRASTGPRADILLVASDDMMREVPHCAAALARTGWTADWWGQAEALAPLVGDRSTGLRSYRAVWWQVGLLTGSDYRSDATRDSLSRYNAGGGRLFFVSYLLPAAWCNPDDNFYSPARCAWLHDELHLSFTQRLDAFLRIRGIPGDPISGDFPADIPYDRGLLNPGGCEIAEVDGTGSAEIVWQKSAPWVPANTAVRWIAGSSCGSPDSAVWGGTPTRTVTYAFEWSHLNFDVDDDSTRARVLDKTLIWLIGRDHPSVVVGYPNGTESLTGSSALIRWTEAFDGAAAGARRLEYTEDGGDSWNLITSSAGPSPYTWDISNLPNGIRYRVRVTVVDDGSPTLQGMDRSDQNFTIARPGGDNRGPMVTAGSMVTSPNPVTAPGTFRLTATVDDSRNGNSNITAAEWCLGDVACAAGSGTPMGGDFDGPVVMVADTVDAAALPAGRVPLWIRGRDAAGQWGPADSMSVYVNQGTSGLRLLDGASAGFALEQSVPNPFAREAAIRFSLARSGPASLSIYDVGGRQVRRLLARVLPAGHYEIRWDGRDERGRRAASGVYFCRLESNDRRVARRVVLMR